MGLVEEAGGVGGDFGGLGEFFFFSSFLVLGGLMSEC